MSDPGAAGALVCGFSDLASGLAGLAWSLESRGGLLLRDDEVREANPEITRDGAATRVKLSSEAGEAEATIAPRTGSLDLATAEGSPPPGGGLEASLCTATLKPAGEDRTLQCFGHLSRWEQNPVGEEATFRHLAIESSDGFLLLVVALGERGADHGAEEIAAWRLDPEGGVMTFTEALLSTQYDREGRHTRTGLELWPGEGEAPPMRAAGTRLGGGSAGDIGAALLRCSTEGSEGLGSYLVRRS
jgi:hypothetical protein